MRRIFILYCLVINFEIIGHSQLSESYIQNYIENYSSNTSLIDFSSTLVSPNKKFIAYHVKRNKVMVFENDLLKFSFSAEKIFFLTNEEIYYQIANKIFLKRLKNGEITEFREFKDIKYLGLLTKGIIIDNYELLHLKNGHLLRYNIIKDTIIRNYNISSHLINLKGKTIISTDKDLIEINDSIYNIIHGNNGSIGISTKYLYDIKNGKIVNSYPNFFFDFSYPLENITSLFFANDEIQINYLKENNIEKEILLTNSKLDIYSFINLSLGKDIKKDLLLKKIRINLKRKEIDSFEISFNEVYNHILKNNHILFTEYHYDGANFKEKNRIYNLAYNLLIDIDSLNINYTNYYLTPDSKYLYLSTLNSELLRYNFTNNEITIISKKFPYRIHSFWYYSNENPIIVSKYDEEKEELYINTKTTPYIIKKDGNIDSNSLRVPSQDKYSITTYYSLNLTNVDNIIANFNLQTGISKFYFKKDKQLILLSENESIKTPDNELFYEISRTGVPLFNQNNIFFWAEYNLLNGINYYKYDVSQKNKIKINISDDKVHDSLHYKYISTLDKDQLITGGIIYPKNYDTSKKYPAIFHIYVNKLNILHFTGGNAFTINSIKNKTSSALISPINLLHQNYIVIYVNIPIEDRIYSRYSYYINKMIENVIQKEKNIDINNLGILGHSRSAGQVFGALIDSTDYIKCAVISNGITSDFLDLLHFNSFDLKNQEFNSRFIERTTPIQNLQMLGKELKNDFEILLKNDPFFNLDNIMSAILFIANEGDKSIASSNMYYTYIKTKLLNKNTYLLNFINEGHNIRNDKNSTIAYNKIINFLNFYLKENHTSKEDWIPNN